MPPANHQQSGPVFKIGLLYVSLTWLCIQLIYTATPIYDLPEILVRGVAFMLIMAFPLILMLAWAYALVHGESKPKQEDDSNGSVQTGNGKVFNAVIIGVLCVSAAIMLADIFVLNDEAEQALGNWNHKIGVRTQLITLEVE